MKIDVSKDFADVYRWLDSSKQAGAVRYAVAQQGGDQAQERGAT
jgi:hypothetical protein